MDKHPIINCHTHLFIAKDVPPFIARKFLSWPLYYLTHLPTILFLYKYWRKLSWYIRDRIKKLRRLNSLLYTIPAYSFLVNLIITYLFVHAIYFLYYFLANDTLGEQINSFFADLQPYLLFSEVGDFLKVAIIVLVFVLSKSSRKLIWMALKFLFKPIASLPSKESLEFYYRYLSIAEITKYKGQGKVFSNLHKMYPENSRFVVLPMDMEFMGAGKPRSYLTQLDKLNQLAIAEKGRLIPFIFVDPRRIRADKKTEGRSFFSWSFSGGKVHLEDCVLKDYLEKKEADHTKGHFKGIKIYPALGYYPFDEDLLPLWLYCVHNNIPITTHCVMGTIFYRGKIHRQWLHHPVFGYKDEGNLPIHAKKNYDIQKNFTHPLNYLVLLEEFLLKQWLKNCREEIQTIFGYTPESGELERNLCDLKINLAHYGGFEEWEKYLNLDRLESSQEIIEVPDVGIEFLNAEDDVRPRSEKRKNPSRPNKPAWLWDRVNVDWYSIISSMMLQYDNVYADISYILHNDEIKPLLNSTLNNPKLAEKVLFGTDYYVVRNHKSEKELLSDLFFGLSEKQIKKITYDNPKTFLKTKEGE